MSSPYTPQRNLGDDVSHQNVIIFTSVINDFLTELSTTNNNNMLVGSLLCQSLSTPSFMLDDDNGVELIFDLIMCNITSPILSYITTLSIIDIDMTKMGLFYSQLTTIVLPRMIGLQELKLNDNDFIRDKIIEMITILPFPCNITSLECAGLKIDNEIFKIMSETFPHLSNLNLERNKITHNGVKYIANLSHLTSLNLSFNHIDDVGVISLLSALMNEKRDSSTHTNVKLTSLSLGGCGITNRGAKALVQSNNHSLLCCLQELDLSYNKIGFDGIQAISHAPILTNLTTLNLTSNQIDKESLLVLASTPLLSNITQLSLGGNRLQNDDISIILSKFDKLTHLDLRDNYIDDLGMSLIISSTVLSGLTSLILPMNQIEDDGANILVKALSTTLINLKVLDLSFNDMSEEGVDIVKGIVGVNSNLTIFNVENNNNQGLGLFDFF